MSELIGTYRLKYYIHASHAIRWEEGTGKAHSHSWEIICEIQSANNEMLVFDKVEQLLEDTFNGYSGKLLNEIQPFDKINPTLENLAYHFFERVSSQLEEVHASLNRLELGESPTRYYCVTRSRLDE